jgi:mersacidin/lichenicidin family type 2 lantibiotic
MVNEESLAVGRQNIQGDGNVRDRHIRAWKDEEYRQSLTGAEQASLPDHPTGILEPSGKGIVHLPRLDPIIDFWWTDPFSGASEVALWLEQCSIEDSSNGYGLAPLALNHRVIIPGGVPPTDEKQVTYNLSSHGLPF